MFKEELKLFSLHIQKRGVTNNMQIKVKNYFDYLNESHAEEEKLGTEMLDKLSETLKEEMKHVL